MYIKNLFRLCWKDKKIKMFICTNIYFTPLYIYIYIYSVCVCVCVCGKIPHNRNCMPTYLPSHKPSKKDKLNMLSIAREVRKTREWSSLMDVSVLAVHQGLKYISSVRTLNAVKMTCQDNRNSGL